MTHPITPQQQQIIDGLFSPAAYDRFIAHNRLMNLNPNAPVTIDADGRVTIYALPAAQQTAVAQLVQPAPQVRVNAGDVVLVFMVGVAAAVALILLVGLALCIAEAL